MCPLVDLRVVLAVAAMAAFAAMQFSGCTSSGEPGVSSAPPATHVPVSVSGPATYVAGQEVHIEWEGTWYAGRVLGVGAGENAGLYSIHNDGWAARRDAWVMPDKLRLPSAGGATGSRAS